MHLETLLESQIAHEMVIGIMNFHFTFQMALPGKAFVNWNRLLLVIVVRKPLFGYLVCVKFVIINWLYNSNFGEFL